MPRLSDYVFSAYAQNERGWSGITIVWLFVAALVVRNMMVHDYREETIEALVSSGKTREEVFASYVRPTISEKKDTYEKKQSQIQRLSEQVEDLRSEVKSLRELVVNGTKSSSLRVPP